MRIVMKFGGTSVGSADRMAHAAQLVVRAAVEGHDVVVVTSAMSQVTNLLVDSAKEAAAGRWDSTVRRELERRHLDVAQSLIAADPVCRAKVERLLAERLESFEKLCFGLSMVRDLTPRLMDAISGIGETLAAPLLSAAIAAAERPSTPISGTDVVVTTDQFGGAEPLMDDTRARVEAHLVPLLAQGIIPVVTGFIGATIDGITTTLGRGGSDYSASILGAALDADEVWIWTDVDGVMSGNPAEVPDARTLREISYSEASELAYYGAKVLHYKTILPAFRQRIPVRILNSFNPDHEGTRVSVDGRPSARGVKAVTSIKQLTLVTISGTGMQGIPGIVAKVFEVVAVQRADVLMISQASSENNICLAITQEAAPAVLRALRMTLDSELARDHIEDITGQPIAIVAAIGDRMRGTPGIAASVLGALSAAGVNVIAISQGASERNISLAVKESDAPDAVRSIHQAFRLDKPHPI